MMLLGEDCSCLRFVLLHLDQVGDFLCIVARSPGSWVKRAERPLVCISLLIEYGHVEVGGLGYGCGGLAAKDSVLTCSWGCYKGLRKLTAHLRVDLGVIV